MAQVKELSFHFSHGQNRKSPSLVFLCSETKRKRLLRRLNLGLRPSKPNPIGRHISFQPICWSTPGESGSKKVTRTWPLGGLGRDGKLESTNGISRLRKYPLYSRCWRKAIKLGSVKVSLVEQMRRSLRARRKGIVRLVCMGWHEEFSKYWCL